MTRPSLADYGTHDESAFPELWEGVVGAWAPCLGPTGLRLHDFSRRQNWGMLTNMDAATDWVVDSGQYAVDLDGSNDVVNLQTDATGSLVDFSYCGWWYLRNANCVGVTRLSGGQSVIFFSTSTTVIFRGETIGSLLTFSVPNLLNRWSFVSLSRSNSIVRCYVDGVQSTTGPLTHIFEAIFDRFGRQHAGGFGLSGLFDDQSFYNRPMSEAEILFRYAGGNGRGIMYQRRRRTTRYFATGPTFQAAWARGSNVIVQPCGVA